MVSNGTLDDRLEEGTWDWATWNAAVTLLAGLLSNPRIVGPNGIKAGSFGDWAVTAVGMAARLSGAYCDHLDGISSEGIAFDDDEESNDGQ